MKNEKRLINPTEYKSFLKRYIKELHEVDAPMIAGAVERCLQKLEMQPTVDAVEVPDENLLKAINILIKQYEHSKRSDYVHNPIAHAFYHTWKQLDESGYGERR